MRRAGHKPGKTSHRIGEQMDKFTEAYIECALWSSTDLNDEPLDDKYGISDIAPLSMKEIMADCESFQRDQEKLLTAWYDKCDETPERAGHDFWLTRNRHGAGFWDRWSGNTPQGKIGKQLTDAAHIYGSCDLYVGDDNLIYV